MLRPDSWKLFGTFGCLVLVDGDMGLAAEPGFHGDPPQGGGSVVIVFRHASDYLPKLVEQQPENGFALSLGPAEALSVVVRREESHFIF